MQDYFFIKSKGIVYEVNIDPQDYDLVRAYTWSLTGDGYIQCSKLLKDKKLFKLHQIIAKRMEIEAKIIDHIDGNKLNNRRSNLRGVTNQQNLMNRGKNKIRKS